MISWHRLIGLGLIDLFTDTGYKVELEKDLSLKQQFLDIVIIEKNEDKPTHELPDGFDNLAQHNLLTYKSHQETLDEWAMQELIGHYVNYRKQISPKNNLLPSGQFCLYAISTRYPQKLLNQAEQDNFKNGYIDVYFRQLKIRIIVLSRMPKSTKNALWQLFSAQRDKILYGSEHYSWHSKDVSSVVNQLYEKYEQEGLNMSYTVEDYVREYRQHDVEALLAALPPEKVLAQLAALPSEKVLSQLVALSPEKVLSQFTSGQLLSFLISKQQSELKTEELLQAMSKLLSPEQIKDYLAKLEEEQAKKH